MFFLISVPIELDKLVDKGFNKLINPKNDIIHKPFFLL